MKQILTSALLFSCSIQPAHATARKIIQLLKDASDPAAAITCIDPADSNYIRVLSRHMDMGIFLKDRFELKSNIPDAYYEVYLNGLLETCGQIQKGKKEGSWIHWYGSEQTGASVKVSCWHADTLQGFSSYYENDGADLRSIFYYINGELLFSESYVQGEVIGRGILFNILGLSISKADNISRSVTTERLMEERRQMGSDSQRVLYTAPDKGLSLNLLQVHGKIVNWDFRRIDPFFRLQGNISDRDTLVPRYRKTIGDTGSADSGFYCRLSETPAQFPGGDHALKQFINRHLRYPPDARANRIEGNASVVFRVDAHGKIDGIMISRSLTPSCDAEAIRLVKSFPRWIPARVNGRTKPCKMNLSIPFRNEE
ncbi:MAG: energy transducer TonB [Chitinophagaceae bacterium]